jgi:hypothetical protein
MTNNYALNRLEKRHHTRQNAIPQTLMERAHRVGVTTATQTQEFDLLPPRQKLAIAGYIDSTKGDDLCSNYTDRVNSGW